jgi:hypothetical protein
MHIIWALVGVAWVSGCASARVDATFDEATLAAQTIRDAEAAGAARCPSAAHLLESAKDEEAYARHVPGDPEHARRLYRRAQVDAELAIVQTRRSEHQRLEARRRELP